jgi:hypothetical protein
MQLMRDRVVVIARSDNKVRELATGACRGSSSVWFDGVGISAFHSCVVVDLWQSLSEWRLLLSECILKGGLGAGIVA